MRDRLKELLEDTLREWECDVSKKTITEISDHLIDNGVIVPPCKVGDTLYEITDGGKITTFTVRSFYHIVRWMEDEVFGFILFTTREEAEKALAERRKNGVRERTDKKTTRLIY